LPASTDAACGWKSSYQHTLATYDATYNGPDADHHPVENVDWCDAYAYCSGVGKRLCGAIGGGSNTIDNYADASKSQWYRACSSGGALTYPYGDAYQSSYCNGYDYWPSTALLETLRVGSLSNCMTSTAGYARVYDLSGNVIEWEDSCDLTAQIVTCRLRGGSFGNANDSLACGYGSSNFRSAFDRNVGFRCCSL